jgi:GxxExxY protein
MSAAAFSLASSRRSKRFFQYQDTKPTRKIKSFNAKDAKDAKEKQDASTVDVLRALGCKDSLERRAMDREAIAHEIVDAAMRVHTKLGPGLLEGAYEACLAYELTMRGLCIAQQVPMPVEYDAITLDVGYRIDILVAGRVVVELKSVDKLIPIHSAQLLSYLRLGRYSLGFLINFNTVHLRDGIKRIINSHQSSCH